MQQKKQHMINYVENELLEDREAKENYDKVVQKLVTITEHEDEAKSESKPTEEEDENYDYYGGFDEDGNRIIEEEG